MQRDIVLLHIVVDFSLVILLVKENSGLFYLLTNLAIVSSEG